MVILKEKVFNAVDILQGEENDITTRLEEGFMIRSTIQEREIIEARIVKIEAKKITLHVDLEIGDRILVWGDLERVVVLDPITLEPTE